MKIRFAFFILLHLIFWQKVIGQPGGDGGVQIEKINGQYDTLYLKGAPIDSLSYRAIKIKGNKIRIQTTALPLITDSGLQYKFILPRVYAIRYPQRQFIVTDRDGYYKYTLLKNTVNPLELYINMKKFTGIVKLFFQTSESGLGRRVYIYKNGKLIKSIDLPAVTDATEKELFFPKVSWDV